MQSPTELEAQFRAQGRKITPQRQLIFRIVSDNHTHPTAEAVHAEALTEMPNLSLRTVYATLHELAELGQLELLDLGTGATRFDPNVEPHHHLVCRRCGQVRDLTTGVDDPDIPAGLRRSFTVDDVEITFRGICADCAAHAATAG